jgi:hypothetical protein
VGTESKRLYHSGSVSGTIQPHNKKGGWPICRHKGLRCGEPKTACKRESQICSRVERTASGVPEHELEVGGASGNQNTRVDGQIYDAKVVVGDERVVDFC